MDLISFVPESLFVVVVATYVMGVFFKNTTIIKNTEIPVALLFCSVLFSMLIEGFGAEACLQGIICYGVSTGVYSLNNEFKKARKGRN